MTKVSGVLVFSIALGVSMFMVTILGGSAIAADSARATAEFVDTEGNSIGTASLVQGPTGVLIHLRVSGIAPGGHAIHIHSIGTCTPDFKASAGHINIHNRKHGLLNPEGPDDADLPNIYATPDGIAEPELFTTRVALSDDGMNEGVAFLFDDDGSALVIHEAPDDHVTQPIGGAGGRIACGIISAAD